MSSWARPPLELWDKWVPYSRDVIDLLPIAGVCKQWRYWVLNHRLKHKHHRKIWSKQLGINMPSISLWIRTSKRKREDDSLPTMMPSVEDLWRWWVSELRMLDNQEKGLRRIVNRHDHVYYQYYSEIYMEFKTIHDDRGCWCSLPGDVWEDHRRQFEARANRKAMDFWDYRNLCCL